jgi:hypothetical protein
MLACALICVVCRRIYTHDDSFHSETLYGHEKMHAIRYLITSYLNWLGKRAGKSRSGPRLMCAHMKAALECS